MWISGWASVTPWASHRLHLIEALAQSCSSLQSPSSGFDVQHQHQQRLFALFESPYGVVA